MDKFIFSDVLNANLTEAEVEPEIKKKKQDDEKDSEKIKDQDDRKEKDISDLDKDDMDDEEARPDEEDVAVSITMNDNVDKGGQIRFVNFTKLATLTSIEACLKLFKIDPDNVDKAFDDMLQLTFRSPIKDFSEEEYEDSYNRYFKENIPPMVKQSKAFHLPYSLNPVPRFEVLNVILSLKEIKNKAAGKGVSITIYLLSIYLFILQEIYENLNILSRHKKNKQLRIQVPVNLRNIYHSKTMRNFSLFVMPQIDLRLGHYTFDEIIKTVYHQMHLETDEKLINKNIARNVGYEKKLLIRGIPLLLKSLILNFKFYSLGTSQYSGVLTNPGRLTFPSEVSEFIDYFILTAPPPNKILKVSCGVIGFNDKLVLSFGNITRSKEPEQKFVKFLSGEGLKIKLMTYTTI